jgi:hypothetical protein
MRIIFATLGDILLINVFIEVLPIGRSYEGGKPHTRVRGGRAESAARRLPNASWQQHKEIAS